MSDVLNTISLSHLLTNNLVSGGELRNREKTPNTSFLQEIVKVCKLCVCESDLWGRALTGVSLMTPVGVFSLTSLLLCDGVHCIREVALGQCRPRPVL